MRKKQPLTNFLFKSLLATFLLISLGLNAKESSSSSGTYNLLDLTSNYASWGISPTNKKSSINLQEAWQILEKPKKKITVAVIDTGIDPTHAFLSDNLFLLDKKITSNEYGVDFSKNSKNKYTPYDSHGHGTHVAGIIKSVDPSVQLLILKYYNPEASGKDNLNSAIDALKYAVDSNVDIINYSGGGPEPSLEELRILKEAEKKGILIVAAAGNDEANIDQKKSAYYPASYGLSNILTVSAYDMQLSMLSVSNYGKYSVDIFAPGHRIKSSYPNGRASMLTGTSQATAFVTGVASLVKSQHPTLDGPVLKKIITASATEEVNFFNKCKSNGRLNAYNAVKMAASYDTLKLTPQRELANKRVGRIQYRLQKIPAEKSALNK